MEDKNFPSIDGSLLEGGGQILRNSVAYSVLTGVPVHVHRIRAKRKDGGLKAQHLTAIKLLEALCWGRLEGGQIRSAEITFYPNCLYGGQFEADIKTAGSVALLIQAALPCLLYAREPCFLVLKGGTNATLSPQIDYLTKVLQPILEKHTGCKFELDIVKRGYYPKGGGEVHLRVDPIKEPLKPIILTDPGKVQQIEIRAFVAGKIPDHVGNRIIASAKGILGKTFDLSMIKDEMVRESPAKSVGDGTGLIIVATTTSGCIFGTSSLGEMGKTAEAVGKEAAEELVKNIKYGGCVEEYLQDQLIIYMALANGESKMLSGPISLHTETAIWIAQTLTKAKFQVEKLDKNLNMITCTGSGHAPDLSAPTNPNPNQGSSPVVISSLFEPPSSSSFNGSKNKRGKMRNKLGSKEKPWNQQKGKSKVVAKDESTDDLSDDEHDEEDGGTN